MLVESFNASLSGKTEEEKNMPANKDKDCEGCEMHVDKCVCEDAAPVRGRNRRARQGQSRGASVPTQQPDMGNVVVPAGVRSSLNDIDSSVFPAPGSDQTGQNEKPEESAGPAQYIAGQDPTPQEVEQVPAPATETSLEDISTLEERVDRSLAKETEQAETAPEYVAAILNLRVKRQEAALAGNQKLTTEIDNLIAKVLEERPIVSQMLTAHNDAERAQRAEQQREDRRQAMNALYDKLPDDPNAEPYPDGRSRKINSVEVVVEKTTQKPGDKAKIVVRLPRGTKVPGPPNFRGWMTDVVILTEDAAVLLEVTVDKIENGDRGRWVFRQAQPIEWVGDLHFHRYAEWREGELGVFNFVFPFFGKKERGVDGRIRRIPDENNPFEALNAVFYSMGQGEYRAHRALKALEAAEATADISITDLVINGAAGVAKASGTYTNKSPDPDRYPDSTHSLAVVLERATGEDGHVMLLNWGRAKSSHGPPPRLGIIQSYPNSERPRIVNLQLEVAGWNPEEGKGTILVRIDEDQLPRGNDDDSRKRSRDMKLQARWLGMTVRTALLAEYRAQQEAVAEPDSAAVESDSTAASPTEESDVAEGSESQDDAAPPPARRRRKAVTTEA